MHHLRLPVTLLLFDAAAYALAFAAAAVLTQVLARQWTRSLDAHWTERARLAHPPAFANLWLAVLLPPPIALITAVGLAAIEPAFQGRTLLTLSNGWLATLAGVLTVRYRWLRQIWGKRVTLRSWLAGCLVLLLLIVPHLVVMVALIGALPTQASALSLVIFLFAIAATAFFAWGGGVILLRFIGVVRPAPANVTEMVQVLAERMNVTRPVKVLELEWAMANALAWVLYRAIGFSRAMLDVMTDDELRAVAAHELAHLAEPRWVRGVRLAHMFAYLPLAPIMKYGGIPGLLIGYVLLMTLLLGYQRFTRRYEELADQAEQKAIEDPAAYTRSLIKLHETNLVPAVMPGAQTHPHLYDRLLAGGHQPDFPRPAAPDRLKPFLAALLTAAVAVVLMLVIVLVAGVAVRLYDERHEPVRPVSMSYDPSVNGDSLASSITAPGRAIGARSAA